MRCPSWSFWESAPERAIGIVVRKGISSYDAIVEGDENGRTMSKHGFQPLAILKIH